MLPFVSCNIAIYQCFYIGQCPFPKGGRNTVSSGCCNEVNWSFQGISIIWIIIFNFNNSVLTFLLSALIHQTKSTTFPIVIPLLCPSILSWITTRGTLIIRQMHSADVFRGGYSQRYENSHVDIGLWVMGITGVRHMYNFPQFIWTIILSIGTCRVIEWRCPEWNWDLMSKNSMDFSQFCKFFFCVNRNEVFD